MNPRSFCAVDNEEWRAHRDEQASSREDIRELKTEVRELRTECRMLRTEVELTRKDMLPAATDRDRFSAKSVQFIQNVYSTIILILLTVIGFLLLGEHFGLIRQLNK